MWTTLLLCLFGRKTSSFVGPRFGVMQAGTIPAIGQAKTVSVAASQVGVV